MTDSDTSAAAVAAALAVLDAHIAALNAGDEAALARTLHFPQYRLSASGMQIWERPDDYLADFHARAGDGWARSGWDSRDVVAASPDKVHLAVQFTRYRADGSSIGHFRSLWVVTRIAGRWAAELRSSFAA
jgi:hypothetical protein